VKTYTVSVTVGQGSITVNPDRQVMTTDDEVQWASGNGKKFTIEFDGAGPFANRRLAFAAATAKQRPRSKGRFKYTVISEDNPTLTLDPEVIVDPPPTGEGP
jgi:hypothetical protein